VRARDLLDEAMSLLRLASDPLEHALGSHISASEGTTWTAMRAPDRLIVRRASEGQLWPPIKYIAEAMSRDTTVQSDWERRTIAASRWHNRAVSAGWPSASLAACFTALECLFVRNRNESRKGETIARRVAQHHAHVPHLPDDEVASWVAALYQRRNKTVHEGIPYGDEIDVERIEELTVAAIHWAAHHLDRNHRSGGTCQAFDEVHDATHE